MTPLSTIVHSEYLNNSHNMWDVKDEFGTYVCTKGIYSCYINCILMFLIGCLSLLNSLLMLG